MGRSYAAALCLLAALVSGLRVDDNARVWRLQDSVNSLDSVISEINLIIQNPNVTAEHVQQAMKVSEDVQANIQAVENGTLSKQKADKLNHVAIAELASFEKDLATATNSTDKLAVVYKMLDEKKAEIAKSEAEAQVLNLEMERKQKEDALQKLKDRKEMTTMKQLARNLSHASRLATVLNATNSSRQMYSVKLNHSSNPNQSLANVLQKVQAYELSVSTELAKVDDEQKKSDETLNDAIKAAALQPGKPSDVMKRRTSLRLKKAEEHRRFSEVRAKKQNELKDLKDAEVSINKHDVTGLHKILARMSNGADLLN